MGTERNQACGGTSPYPRPRLGRLDHPSPGVPTPNQPRAAPPRRAKRGQGSNGSDMCLGFRPVALGTRPIMLVGSCPQLPTASLAIRVSHIDQPPSIGQATLPVRVSRIDQPPLQAVLGGAIVGVAVAPFVPSPLEVQDPTSAPAAEARWGTRHTSGEADANAPFHYY